MIIKKNLFLLSVAEVKKYLGTKESRQCECRGELCWWWLRTFGHSLNYTACIDKNGNLYDYGVSDSCRNIPVRPAMYIDTNFLPVLKCLTDGCVKFGGLKWLVLDKESGLVLAKEAFEENIFSDSNNVDSSISIIHSYLNHIWIKKVFNAEERQMIMSAVVNGEFSYV